MSQGEVVLRTTVGACLLVGLFAFFALSLTGNVGAGFALATGLGIGSVNGFLTRHSLTLGMSFWATSIGRLIVLSAAGMSVALFLDPAVAWLVPAGIGAAQLIMAGVALRQAVRV